MREETEEHFKKNGNSSLPCQTMACDVEEPMALVKRIESRQLGRRGSGPTAEISLRRELTHDQRCVIRHNREMKYT
jgi:hypothetical protein